MRDDERLKRIATDVVRFEPTIEGVKILSDGVLRLLAERDQLASELANARHVASVFEIAAQSAYDQLAELRAACEPIRKGNWPANFFDTMTMQPVIGFRDPPLLGDMRRIAALLARTPEAVATPPV